MSITHLDPQILNYLSKVLARSIPTVRKNISLMRHEYPKVTPNGVAQIYAKKNGKTVWAKLSQEDRESLPNFEFEKARTVRQKKTSKSLKRVVELIKYETSDPFKKAHIEEINRSFTYRCYTSVFILCRKIIENFLIDILRKKFPDKVIGNKELYFDIHRNRFKDFSEILKNFKLKSNEFGLEKKLVERIASLSENLKDNANDKAHSWYHIVRKSKEIDDLDIQQLIDAIKELENRLL